MLTDRADHIRRAIRQAFDGTEGGVVLWSYLGERIDADPERYILQPLVDAGVLERTEDGSYRVAHEHALKVSMDAHLVQCVHPGCPLRHEFTDDTLADRLRSAAEWIEAHS